MREPPGIAAISSATPGANLRTTYGKNTICHNCYAPRGLFLSPLAKEQTEKEVQRQQAIAHARAVMNGDAPPATSAAAPKKKKSKKQRMREKAKEETTTAATAPTTASTKPAAESNDSASKTQQPSPTAASGGTAPVATAQNGKVTIPLTTLEQIRDLAPAILPLVDSLAKEWLPQAREDEWVLEDEVKKLLEHKAPGEDTAPLKAAEAKVKHLTMILADTDIAEDFKNSTETLLTQATKERDTLLKKTPTPGARTCGINVIVSEFKQQIQKRTDRRAAGKNAAEARVAQRTQLILNLKGQITHLETALTEIHRQCAETHRQRDLVDSEHDTAILQELESKAGQSGSSFSSSASPVNSADGVQPPSADLQSLQLRMDRMQQEHQRRQDLHHRQMETMQKRQEAMRGALVAKAKEEESFALTAEISVDDLTPLTLPPSSDLAKYGQLHQLMCSWMAAGASTCFTLGDLALHSHFGQDVALFLRSALGSHWKKWFTAEVGPETTVPKQVAELLFQTLERLKDSWLKQQEVAEKIRDGAAGSFSAFCDAGKKRRAAVLEVEMTE